MSRAICIQFSERTARFAVVHLHGDRVVVEKSGKLDWADDSSDQQRGAQLAQALTGLKIARTPVVAAVDRQQLSWQAYELPPAPPEDLVDLIRLQADREQLAESDDPFDFVPLDGDEQHPHRAIGIAMPRTKVASIQTICDSVGLELKRLTVAEFGWPALGNRLTRDDPGLRIGLAIASDQAIVWAISAGQLRMLRTSPLPGTSPAAQTKALSGELRRTALAATSLSPPPGDAPWQLLGDEQVVSQAETLSQQIGRPIEAVPLAKLLTLTDESHEIAAETIACIGLAAAEAEGRAAPVDLLHPRQRPKPPSGRKKWSLIGAAALLLVSVSGLQAYRNVRAPTLSAADAAAEEEELRAEIELLADDVQQHDRVAQWLAESPNLLDELTYLSRQLRPKPLDSADFNVEQDAVAMRLMQTQRQFELTASIRDASVAGDVEGRLRDSTHKVSRQRLEPADDAPAGYSQRLVATIQRVQPTDDAEALEAP